MKFHQKLLIAASIAKRMLLEEKAPFLVSWSLTNRCNYKCKYCNIWNTESEELNTEQVLFIIDELSKCGTKAIAFSGGEPLLREDIAGIIEYCSKKNIYTKLTTNGSLVQNKIDDIKNISQVKMSFDGPREIHDLHRQVDSYEQVIKAVKILKEHNIKVGLNCVISKLNVEHLDFVLKKTEQLKVKVTFQPLEYRSSKDFIFHNMPSEIRYKQAFGMLISEKKRGNKYIANSLPALKYLYNRPFYKKMKCWAGIFHCRITSNGNLLSCDRLQSYNNSFDCLKQDIKSGFKTLPKAQCIDGCWRNSTIELNYLLSLNPLSILNLMNIF